MYNTTNARHQSVRQSTYPPIIAFSCNTPQSNCAVLRSANAAKSTMAQLDTLPSELLQTILSFLLFSDRHKLAMRRSDADVEQSGEVHRFAKLRIEAREKRIIAQRTLRSLCLVSKQFQTLAEPFLYSSWKPYEEAEYNAILGWTDKQNICLQVPSHTCHSC